MADTLDRSRYLALRRRHGNYPSGIPRRIAEGMAAKISAQEPLLTFLTRSLASEHRSLLERAIVQGLKLELTRVVIREQSEGQSRVDPALPLGRCLLVCGSEFGHELLHAGQLEARNQNTNWYSLVDGRSVPVKITSSIEKVARDKSEKRLFWADLQAVQPLLIDS